MTSDKQYIAKWQEYRDNIHRATPVNLSETTAEKARRIKALEANPEEWYRYYFPNFYSSKPAPFHIESTNRVLENPEFFEMRIWARELAKSARTMMDVLFLSLTGRKRNWIYVSATEDSAVRLLLPLKSQLEKNNRLINDYGLQESLNWSAGEFVTKSGVAFRAIGAGQSPRGTRNDEFRPDGIVIDDIDTDEECRNPTRIDNKVNWVMEALIPTRSISGALLVIVCGNIIAKKSTVTELRKYADHVSLVNIRDIHGKSTWPEKNTEANIDRVLSKMSYAASQKEYFNNPVTQGKTFRDMYFGKCPPLNLCEQVIVYADPATSNKDRSGSTKAVVVVGYLHFKFYVYTVWLDQMGTAKFVEALYAADQFLSRNKVDVKRIWIENNSLQAPFYEQVILPAIKRHARQTGHYISISPDTRKKAEKYYRIEGTLEPVHRRGELVFNKEEEDNPHMLRFKEQWLSVDPGAVTIDGPDALEGAVHKIQNRTIQKETTYVVAPQPSRRH